MCSTNVLWRAGDGTKNCFRVWSRSFFLLIFFIKWEYIVLGSILSSLNFDQVGVYVSWFR